MTPMKLLGWTLEYLKARPPIAVHPLKDRGEWFVMEDQQVWVFSEEGEIIDGPVHLTGSLHEDVALILSGLLGHDGDWLV